MSRIAQGLSFAALLAAGLLSAAPASAVPIDYTLVGLRGEFSFDSSGSGSGSFSQEWAAADTDGDFLADTLVSGDGQVNDFRATGDATAVGLTSTFDPTGLVLEWFEADAPYAFQDFSFLIDNRFGTRSYANAYFSLNLDVLFYGGLDDDGDLISRSVQLSDFRFALPDVQIGSYFLASYSLTDLPSLFDENLLGVTERLVQSDLGKGFLLTANVPSTFFSPVGGPGGGDDGGGNTDHTRVPEPTTLVLFALGLLGLGAAQSRGRRRAVRGSV